MAHIPPPLYLGAAFAGGLALRAANPALGFGSGPVVVGVGGGLCAAGVFLTVAGVVQVRRAGTTIVPHRPVTALLTSGVYRFSRNPMYTGLTVAYLGGALLSGSWGPLLTWPVAILCLQVLVIGPEERYLGERFGDAYRVYRAQTHRWLGLVRRVSSAPAGSAEARTAADPMRTAGKAGKPGRGDRR
ncbi:MAG: isoprenylcysteine carboxylmethyltransferase family protein [Nakamurella sp.]